MRPMIDTAIVLLAALVAGTTFCILVGYDPTGISGPAYVEVQQGAIRGLNVLIPALGGACILLTLADAWLSRAERGRAVVLLIAAGFLIAAALITRFGNQPINAVVIGWDAQHPPPEWQALRDRWWHWHVIRTWAALAGLALIAIGTRRKG
jgi:uncharacterized membrane protein